MLWLLSVNVAETVFFVFLQWIMSLLYLVCEHVYSEEKWVPSLLLIPNNYSKSLLCGSAHSKYYHLHCIYSRTLFKWATAAGHHQKVTRWPSSWRAKSEGQQLKQHLGEQLCNAATWFERTAFVRRWVCEANMFLWLFLTFENAGCPFAFQIKCGHFVLSVLFARNAALLLSANASVCLVLLFPFPLPFQFGLCRPAGFPL